jgi:hypothetical protein
MKVLASLERKPQPPKLNAFDQYLLDKKGAVRG